jgi:phospholipase/carboxylesterase
MYYSLNEPGLLSLEPPAAAQQLIILLHGVGSRPASLLGMAEAFREAWPGAAIALPAGLQPFDGAGQDHDHSHHQWFSIRGVTEDNRPERVTAALPGFLGMIRSLQETTRVPPADTVIAGFSQGAIMALEAIAAADGLAGRVLSFSGRYARLPATAPTDTSLSFYHGDNDEVIPLRHAQAAFDHLAGLGADVSLDIAHGVGHEPHPVLVAEAIDRLRNRIPARLWKRALGG